jgi:hypothetical protein
VPQSRIPTLFLVRQGRIQPRLLVPTLLKLPHPLIRKSTVLLLLHRQPQLRTIRKSHKARKDGQRDQRLPADLLFDIVSRDSTCKHSSSTNYTYKLYASCRPRVSIEVVDNVASSKFLSASIWTPTRLREQVLVRELLLPVACRGPNLAVLSVDEDYCGQRDDECNGRQDNCGN